MENREYTQDMGKRVGQKIREIRENLGLSQAVCALHLDVKHQQWSKWETGHDAPRLRTLYHISCVLGTTVSEIVSVLDIEQPDLPPVAESHIVEGAV